MYVSLHGYSLFELKDLGWILHFSKMPTDGPEYHFHNLVSH